MGNEDYGTKQPERDYWGKESAGKEKELREINSEKDEGILTAVGKRYLRNELPVLLGRRGCQFNCRD